MDRIDALVIGAGAVGLACARALALAGRETLVVEAEGAIGQGVSSRNSEVIHAGLYYAPGSLKARLCVQGKHQMVALCRRHGVGHRQCGKLVVATDESQHAALERLAERAARNGVPVEHWSAERAMAAQPGLHCTAALWSPSTGIVDSHGFMLALQAELEQAGGQVALASRVRAVRFASGQDAVVQVTTAEGGEAFELQAGVVVNAAGLWACHLARRFEGLGAAHVPVPRLAKGSYFALGVPAPFDCLVYPAPVDAWLGVHLTLDLGGQARFGPDLEWLPHDDPAAIDYAVHTTRLAGFEEAIRRYWPGLPPGQLHPAYSGVRPKIHGPGEAAPDFRIDGPAEHGVAGLVNLFGIESPGLTSAMAIADEVVARLGGMGGVRAVRP